MEFRRLFDLPVQDQKSAERYGTTFRCPSVCHPMAQIDSNVERWFKLTYTRKNHFRQTVKSR
jgi:hypothetical protein